MPRDGMLPSEPPAPTRDQILASIRQQNSGHLIEQVISLEADKAVLMNELIAARRRIAELEQVEAERRTAMVEPTDAGTAGL